MSSDQAADAIIMWDV